MRCLAVLGLRRSGLPAALLARRELAGARVVALDEGDAPPKDAVAELRAAGSLRRPSKAAGRPLRRRPSTARQRMSSRSTVSPP